MILKQWYQQQRVAMKQNTKIHKEACCFALKVGLKRSNKEKKYNKELVKNIISLQISKPILIRSRGLEKIEKLISGEGRLLGT